MNMQSMLTNAPEIRSPYFPSDRSEEETKASFRHLFWLKRSFGRKPNKDVLAAALIGACILEGFDKSWRIEGALRVLGIKPNHAIGILNGFTGDDPARHRWWIDDEGTYRLHETALS